MNRTPIHPDTATASPAVPTVDPTPAGPAAASTGSSTAAPAVASLPAAVRYRFLDALRGVALCGILFVNLRDLLADRITVVDSPVQRFYDVGIQGRFVPVFAFLFGVSAWLLYSATKDRASTASAASARLLMVRRFACLLPVGLLNLLFLFDGDILTMYSVFALVLLVPAMFLPRGLLLTVGLASTVAAYWVFGNSPMIAATLMVTGFAAAQFGLPAWLESQSGQDHGVAFSVFGVFGLSAIGGMVFAARQLDLLVSGAAADTPSYDRVAGIAGLLIAVALVSGLSLVWRTVAGRLVLDRIFTPLGRTSLTNYLGASLLVQVGLLVLPGELTDLRLLPVITVGVLAVQWMCSVLWLRVFRYGPVEWVWRMATRWERMPLRRDVTGTPAPR
jgi:uncharacterized membrane protein YeiB